MTQPELASLSKRVCLLHKQIQYVFCNFWLYKFFDLLAGLARFMKVSWLSKHEIAHPRKLDRFFFFAQAPYNQNKVFNKQGVLTWEMGWPTKWRGYTYKRNKKTWPTYQTNPGYQVSLSHLISPLAIKELLKELRYS